MTSKKTQHDSETPAHGKQVISAVAFIHKKVDGVDKVFLVRRASTKKFLPGLWEMPGGHTDFGEEIVAGLKREIDEELSMEIEVGDCFYCFTYMNEIKGSHTAEAVFFAQFTTAESEIKLLPEDHSESGWFSRDELLEIQHEIDASVSEYAEGVTLHTQDDPEWLALLKGFDTLEAKNGRYKDGSHKAT